MAPKDTGLSSQDHAIAILALLHDTAPAAVLDAITLAMDASMGVVAGPSVADLLNESRAKHVEYRRCCGTPQSAGDPVAARAALEDAARLRAQAELLDPDHEQVGWLAEVGTTYEHDPLIEWYADHLSRTA